VISVLDSFLHFFDLLRLKKNFFVLNFNVFFQVIVEVVIRVKFRVKTLRGALLLQLLKNYMKFLKFPF